MGLIHYVLDGTNPAVPPYPVSGCDRGTRTVGHSFGTLDVDSDESTLP